MINKKDILGHSDILTFRGSFDKTNNRTNILLLLPKTRGPFGIKKFKKLIEKNFNLLEYDDVLSEQSKIFKQSHEKRIYLLCKPDIKWEYDPQRENKKNRNEIFDIYEKEITKLNYSFFIIDGEKRLSKAQKIIKKFFK